MPAPAYLAFPFYHIMLSTALLRWATLLLPAAHDRYRVEGADISTTAAKMIVALCSW